jgi:hypothetical protein
MATAKSGCRKTTAPSNQGAELTYGRYQRIRVGSQSCSGRLNLACEVFDIRRRIEKLGSE